MTKQQQQITRKPKTPEPHKAPTKFSTEEARAALRRCHRDREFRARVISKAANSTK